jgi:hypothetical protein
MKLCDLKVIIPELLDVFAGPAGEQSSSCSVLFVLVAADLSIVSLNFFACEGVRPPTF